MGKQIIIFWLILFTCILIKNNVTAQNIQYPLVDSVKVIPEFPSEYVDQLKAVVYSKNKRTNCELDSIYFTFSHSGNYIYLRANYSTENIEIECFRVDTIPLIGFHKGDHTLHLFARTYSDIETLVDTTLVDFTVYEDLSLKTESSFSNINLYPNPIQNQLNFTISTNASKMEVEIYDLSGKRIYNQEYNHIGEGKLQNVIDVSTLRKGIYFCKFSNGTKVVIRKFVKE